MICCNWRGNILSLFLIVSLVVTGLIALPRISEYYRFPKSNGEQLAAELQQVYRDHLPVYVIPGYEEKVYRFYLLTEGSSRSVEIVQALHPMSWEDLQQLLWAGRSSICG